MYISIWLIYVSASILFSVGYMLGALMSNSKNKEEERRYVA